MRKLNNKQKKVIEKYLNETGVRVFDYDDSRKVREELEKLNWYETLWCDANRYGNDYILNTFRKKAGLM